MHRTLGLGGTALVAAAAGWHFHFAERYTQRITPGWNVRSRYVGFLTNADSTGLAFPAKDAVSEYQHTMAVVSETARPGAVLVEDRFTTVDLSTGKVSYEYTTRALLNPRTGEHTDPRYRGQHAVFPREVERRGYRLRSGYVEGIPVAFAGDDEVQGLATYKFDYRGRAEYTASYVGSGEYAGVKIPEGQEARCADDQFYYRVWVEPASGAVVKLEEGCPSGDYIVEAASGRRLAALTRWTGVTAGDDLTRRLAEVRGQRTRYLWASRYLPLTLLAAGLALLAAGARPRRVETAS